MQLTMKKLGAAAIAGALALCIAPAMAMVAPGQAHAAGKTDLTSKGISVDVDVETSKYDVKKDTYKDLTVYRGGKQVKPKVSVYFWEDTFDDEGNWTGDKRVTLKKNKDYTITYKNNKNVGQAYVIIKGKGNYKGTIAQSYSINPKATKVTKVKGAKKALNVSWKKLSAKQADGYTINVYTRGAKYTQTIDGKNYTRYNYRLATSKLVKGASASSTKVTGLKAKTKYYVTVAPYKFAEGAIKSTLSKYNSKDEYVGRRVVNTTYADTFWGDASDYKSGKTK